MIYKKDANFPYPLLTNTSTSYESSQFILDVDLQENASTYRFNIKYNIDSDFMNRLLEKEQAQLILVIQSKDNKFYKLRPSDTFVEISKSRISVSKRTSIQLHLQAKENIHFNDNNDLSGIYQQYRDVIMVRKHSTLGFSNVVIFDSRSNKPLDLFEKKLDPTLLSDIKIELGHETIIIHYKSEELQFNNLPMSNSLNNPYIYMGLQKALQRFIVNNGDDEQVDLEEIELPDDQLDLKLYNLMKKKMIREISIDTIDEVIYVISEKILEKFTVAVKGLSSNGN
ncbi:hypothetical protein ACIQXQ_11450 [Peribacillus sp. NPDC097198]|uniref:hypothetical protein n=1 Tax=Peribacillus sp. NPDC097198 TaxID=3364397 RepID=UPI00382193DE